MNTENKTNCDAVFIKNTNYKLIHKRTIKFKNDKDLDKKLKILKPLIKNPYAKLELTFIKE